MSATGIGRGAGISANAGANRYNAATWTTGAFDATDYFTWTLTPNSDFEIDFTSFVYTGQASGTGPTQFDFRSSADGFAANIAYVRLRREQRSIWCAALQDKTTATEFRLYGFGNTSGGTAGTYSVNDFTFNGSVNSLEVNNDTTITAPASAALGRVMLHQTPSTSFNLTKTGNEATTYTATGPAGISVTSDGNIAGGSQSEPVGVQLQNVTAGSASTGAKAYNVTIDNTAATTAGANKGSADTDDVVNVTATVVDNRTISASPVDLGNVIKGALTAPATSALTTTGNDDNFTRVTVNGTAATNGPVTVAAGANQLFDGTADTVIRSVSGTFPTAGATSGSVVMSVSGEVLTGEAVNSVSVAYTAKVYDASSAAFVSNDGTTVNVNFGTFLRGSGVHTLNEAIYNILQTNNFTAELDFDSISGIGDTSVLFTDLMAGEFTNLTAGIGNAYGFLMKFDTNNPTGVYSASYDLALSDSDLYTGHGATGSQHLTLNLTGMVVPESGWTILIILVLGLPAMAVCRRSLA